MLRKELISMKQLFYGLAALLLLCGQLSFAQEPKKEQPKDMTPPGSAGMMLATAEEMAGLRLGLLAAERKTLEVRADWLRAEQKAFQSDVSLHTLVVSTNPQTIGIGGNINTDRPVKIENAGLIISGQDAEYPITVVFSVDEYARVRDKVAEAAQPTMLYYDAAFPLGKIYLKPVPSAANTLVLYRWSPFTAIATVGTTVTLPPGYEEAFDYNLAKRLAAGGFGRMTALALDIARDSLDRIKSLNVQIPVLRSHAISITGGDTGRGDIYSGWY